MPTDWSGYVAADTPRTRWAIPARVHQRALLGLPTVGNRSRVYPVWQFRADAARWAA